MRQQWVYNMHACAAIHDVMTSLSGKERNIIPQRVGFKATRREQDIRNMNQILEWFHSHDLFDKALPQLRSLSGGLAASEGDGIKCDETEVADLRCIKS